MNSSPKVQTIIGKMHLTVLRIKNFFSMKDTIDKGNRWATDWEKIIRAFITDKELISRIIKQFLQINNKKRGSGKDFE